MFAWTMAVSAVLSGLGFVRVGLFLAFKNGFFKEVFIQRPSMVAQLVSRLTVNLLRNLGDL